VNTPAGVGYWQPVAERLCVSLQSARVQKSFSQAPSARSASLVSGPVVSCRISKVRACASDTAASPGEPEIQLRTAEPPSRTRTPGGLQPKLPCGSSMSMVPDFGRVTLSLRLGVTVAWPGLAWPTTSGAWPGTGSAWRPNDNRKKLGGMLSPWAWGGRRHWATGLLPVTLASGRRPCGGCAPGRRPGPLPRPQSLQLEAEWPQGAAPAVA
jgi:hypothetical protein